MTYDNVYRDIAKQKMYENPQKKNKYFVEKKQINLMCIKASKKEKTEKSCCVKVIGS